MKKLIALFVLLSAATVHMFALDFSYEGLNYTVIDEAAKTCMTKAGRPSTPGSIVSGDLVIPETANNEGVDYTVVEIGEYSFCSKSSQSATVNRSLTSVVIPKTVTKIGEWAFSYCKGLKSIEIPNSVKIIGQRAFCYSGIKSIVIPNSVTAIEDNTFLSCDSLTSVEIPNSVTTIGLQAFRFTAITMLKLPNSVKSIRQQAFSTCAKLGSVELSNSLDSIASGAFRYCEALTSIDIPASVTYLDEKAFASCSNLKAINVDENNKDYCSISGIVWNKEGTKVVIVPDAYSGSLEIPSTATAIADYAFSGREGLTSIIIPNTVTSIGNSAFNGCTGLTTITIPNSVTSIGDYAFNSCTELTSITMSNSVVSIGNYAFRRCTQLASMSLPNTLTTIGDGAFEQCDFTTITIPKSVTTIGASPFSKCWSLKEILVEEGNTAYCSINGSLFNKEATKIVSVPCGLRGTFEIPNTVTEIGDYAFCGSRFRTITIPNSVSSIGKGAFESCVISTITLPNGLSTIKDKTFDNCGSLETINIPGSVTSIGSSAFYRCYKLKTITIPNTVTSIGFGAFSQCSGLISITLPNSLNVIESATFAGCSGLTSVNIPNSVTSIGDHVFSGCSGLTSINIPNTVTSIGDNAFNECSGLTSITIPNSVSTIGIGVFKKCSNLTSVIIPSSVTTINNNAFDECDKLANIQCYASVPPMANSSSFSQNVYNAATLYVPEGTKERYAKADAWKEFKNVEDNLPMIGNVDMTARLFTDRIMVIGEQISWMLNLKPANAVEYVEFSTSKENIITIDKIQRASGVVNAMVSAKSYGTVTLTAKCDNTTVTCGIAVVPYSVTLDCNKADLDLAEQKQLSASLFPARNATIVWASSNTNVAEVSADGLITAKAPGEAVITATCGDGSAYCIVNVPQPDDVPEVKLSIKLALAQKLQLSAIISPENADDEVVWTSTNPEIVAVADDGTVTAKALGNAVVTATCGERSASCVFNVEESAGDITGIDDINSEVSNEVVVYNLQGILMDVSTREELKELPAGYYIVNNQVELVK